MLSSLGQVFIVALLASTVTHHPGLGSEVVRAFGEDELAADVGDSLGYNPKIGCRLPESSDERLPLAAAAGTAPKIGRRLPESSGERSPLAGAAGTAPKIGRRLPESSDERSPLAAAAATAPKIGRRLPESSGERLPLAPAAGTAGSAGEEEGGHLSQRRRKRFWSASDSSSSSQEEQPDTSGYAAAFDALLDYHAQVQREARRVVNMPDMRKETSDKLLFFTVTTRMAVSGVRLRVPATLRRVSRVTARTVPDVGIDMSCNVRLGDFETWGQYNVKVSGVGPSGDFETTIRDRVVRATIRFRELPEATTARPGEASVGAEAEVAPPPPRCSLEATELVLVERGRDDVPAVLSRWASQVEDVPTTLRVMKDLLNERLLDYPCSDGFVALVRRGYAAPS